MNILYIFGNGFDKALGMATSYPEFYDYLKDKENGGSVLLQEMQKEITRDTELWADMELGLGKFTSITNNIEEFDAFYFELSEHLRDYLKYENDKFTPTTPLRIKVKEDLTNIHKYIENLDKARFDDFLKPYGNSYKEINVITLNYTNSFEKIFNIATNGNNIGLNNAQLRQIIHLHGQLDNSIILGVDNESQIANEEFRKIEDIKDCLVKMQSNQAMKETRHVVCKDLIDNAHLIVLFGVSLGDTDACWWKCIGKNLEKRKNLAIIQHLYAPEEVPPTQLQKRGRLERKHQQLILQKLAIEEGNRTDEIKNKLFFTLNKSIFKL